MMDSSTLRRAAVFHAVGLAGGITAAGERLGKSAPAVHADLRRFERDLGLALTERVGRGLRLTAQGREIFDAVGRTLADLDRACALARDAAPDRRPIRLGTVTGFGRYRLMPRLLPRLPADVQLIVRTDTHDALIAALANNSIDLALTYRPVIAAPYRTIKVASEEIGLVGALDSELDHALQGRLRFITYDEYDYVFGRWFADAAGGQPSLLHRHDHFTELEEALASVALGRGATIAPLDACAAFGLEPTGPVCRNDIHLCGTGTALDSPHAHLITACLVSGTLY